MGPEKGKKVSRTIRFWRCVLLRYDIDRLDTRSIHSRYNLERCSAKPRRAWLSRSALRCVVSCRLFLLDIHLNLLKDLYGRGYSDAPQTTYDVNLYTMQLALLMQYLKWDKAHIVGLSMGGGIAAAFVAQFPHLVDEGVGLIASAGLIEVCVTVQPVQVDSLHERFDPCRQPIFHVRSSSCPRRSFRGWHHRGLYR